MKQSIFLTLVLIAMIVASGCGEETKYVETEQSCDITQNADNSVTILCGESQIEVPPNVVTVTETQILEVPVYFICKKKNKCMELK